MAVMIEGAMGEGLTNCLHHALRRSSTIPSEELIRTINLRKAELRNNLRRAESWTITSVELGNVTARVDIEQARPPKECRPLIALPVRRAASMSDNEKKIQRSGSSTSSAAMISPKGVGKVPARARSYEWEEITFYPIDLSSLRMEEDNDALVLSDSNDPQISEYSQRHLYIHKTRTQDSLASHAELKMSMDELQQWTMLAPGNCCLSYQHNVVGEVVTLPWPDMEASAPEEIDEFVNTVNRLEGRNVFFTSYGRSPYSASKLASICRTVSGSTGMITISKKVSSLQLAHRN